MGSDPVKTEPATSGEQLTAPKSNAEPPDPGSVGTAGTNPYPSSGITGNDALDAADELSVAVDAFLGALDQLWDRIPLTLRPLTIKDHLLRAQIRYERARR